MISHINKDLKTQLKQSPSRVLLHSYFHIENVGCFLKIKFGNFEHNKILTILETLRNKSACTIMMSLKAFKLRYSKNFMRL